MEDKDASIAKESLKEIFQFCIYKLDNNLCTPEEIKSLERMVSNNIELNASISQMAEFYGVSETNVRATIARKLFAKPIRVVLYPFHLFRKIKPSKWKVK